MPQPCLPPSLVLPSLFSSSRPLASSPASLLSHLSPLPGALWVTLVTPVGWRPGTPQNHISGAASSAPARFRFNTVGPGPSRQPGLQVQAVGVMEWPRSPGLRSPGSGFPSQKVESCGDCRRGVMPGLGPSSREMMDARQVPGGRPSSHSAAESRRRGLSSGPCPALHFPETTGAF